MDMHESVKPLYDTHNTVKPLHAAPERSKRYTECEGLACETSYLHFIIEGLIENL